MIEVTACKQYRSWIQLSTQDQLYTSRTWRPEWSSNSSSIAMAIGALTQLLSSNVLILQVIQQYAIG